MKKVKAGIITMHRVVNYGSFLQTYATQKIFKNIGCRNEIIDYFFPNQWHLNSDTRPKKTKIGIKTKLKKVFSPQSLTVNEKLNYSLKKYLKLSKEYRTPQEIHQNPPQYNIYVTGSDQTWNPKHTKGDSVFLLSFAPKNAKKISFSASFASEEIEEKYKPVYTKNLVQYEHISVRDNNGLSIVNDLTGKKAEITLDPTLLLDKNQWLNTFSPLKKLKRKNSYILFYLITHSFNPEPYIYGLLKNLQEETNQEILSFNKIPEKYGIIYKFIGNSGPEEFIDLFINASHVVTSSFHGTAFSVNFGIPLYSVYNHDNRGDDRQLSLLEKVGAENCAVPIGKPFDMINPNYDVKKVRKNLTTLRNKSIDYLKRATAE